MKKCNYCNSTNDNTFEYLNDTFICRRCFKEEIVDDFIARLSDSQYETIVELLNDEKKCKQAIEDFNSYINCELFDSQFIYDSIKNL